MNVSDEVWMWVHQKYGMSVIKRKLYSIETNNWSYLSVTDNGQLNRQNNECEWCIMNISNLVWMWIHWNYGMSQITQKLYSIKTNNCSYVAVPVDVLLNQWNNECDLWSMNVIASKLWS